MNVTLSVDRKLLEKARQAAQSMGLSLNELIRRYLQQVTAEPEREALLEEIRRLSLERGGHSAGWKFNRDEVHER